MVITHDICVIEMSDSQVADKIIEVEGKKLVALIILCKISISVNNVEMIGLQNA